jgi:hypothetical protein
MKLYLSLSEFTYLQRRIIIEVSTTKWSMRSETAILEAIEDERKKITDWIANDMAVILDRQENPMSAIGQLLHLKLIDKIEHSYIYENKKVTDTYYQLSKHMKVI